MFVFQFNNQINLPAPDNKSIGKSTFVINLIDLGGITNQNLSSMNNKTKEINGSNYYVKDVTYEKNGGIGFNAVQNGKDLGRFNTADENGMNNLRNLLGNDYKDFMDWLGKEIINSLMPGFRGGDIKQTDLTTLRILELQRNWKEFVEYWNNFFKKYPKN